MTKTRDSILTFIPDFRGAPLFAETIETKLQSIAYKCLEIQEKSNVDLE